MTEQRRTNRRRTNRGWHRTSRAPHNAAGREVDAAASWPRILVAMGDAGDPPVEKPKPAEPETAAEREFDRKLLAWKEQESIAMHFNDLIARFRVQALGGTATIGAVGVLVTSKADANSWTFVALLAFLFVSWTALWLLDYGYYQKLLGGSVKTLMLLETELPPWARMSTNIEQSFVSAHHGHFYFYALIQIALGCMFNTALYAAAGSDGQVFKMSLVGWLAWAATAMGIASRIAGCHRARISKTRGTKERAAEKESQGGRGEGRGKEAKTGSEGRAGRALNEPVQVRANYAKWRVQPFRNGSATVPSLITEKKNGPHLCGPFCFSVECRGIEPLTSRVRF